MSACAGCGQGLSWINGELVDPEDGAPHRLTCPALLLDRRRLSVREENCDHCRMVTRHQVVSDRRSALYRCLLCGRGREVRPLRTPVGGRRG